MKKIFFPLLLLSFFAGSRAWGLYGNMGESTSATNQFSKLFNADMSPIQLTYVDFKIERGRTADNYGKDIGRYNFRPYGCKRTEKKVVLDENRAMNKDMRFFDEFFKEMSVLVTVLPPRSSPYYDPVKMDKIDPEYIVTAEIKDLYMNVCDEYDFKKSLYKGLRSGTAEIEVVFRVMTPYLQKVVWEDSAHGYARIDDPVRNGETRLAEKAFADAIIRIAGTDGFISVLKQRRSKRELQDEQREAERLYIAFLGHQKRVFSSYGDNVGERTLSSTLEREVKMEDLRSGIGSALEKQIAADRELGKTDVEKETVDYSRNLESLTGLKFENGNNKCLVIVNQYPFKDLPAPPMYKIRNSVVKVETETAAGSGILISPNIVLTNYFFLEDNVSVRVSFLDKREVEGILFRYHKGKDVALLYIPEPPISEKEWVENWNVPLRIDLPQINKDFYTIASPPVPPLNNPAHEGGLEPSKLTGYRYLEDGIDLLATSLLQRENSGGALVDPHGKIVGIAHSGSRRRDFSDSFIPVGDAFHALNLCLREPDKKEPTILLETPSQKAFRLKEREMNF